MTEKNLKQKRIYSSSLRNAEKFIYQNKESN